MVKSKHVISRLGFFVALRFVLRLRPGGILSLGPPCGSFIWCNLGTSQRTEESPLGNIDVPSVLLGNLLLDINLNMNAYMMKIHYSHVFSFSGSES